MTSVKHNFYAAQLSHTG